MAHQYNGEYPETVPDDDIIDVAGEIVQAETKAIVPVSRAELDIQVATAKAYPRDLSAWRAGVLAALAADPNLAAVCTYNVRKGDGQVQGPSIRMAQLLVGEWGNLRCRITQGSVGEDRLTARCEIWDLERNVAFSAEEGRSIRKSQTKGGGRFSHEQIENTMRSAMAFAVRSAVFKTIPERLWRPLWAESQKLAQVEEAKDLPERRKVALSFCKNKLKLTDAQVAERLGIEHADQMDAAKLIELRQILESIKSGATTVDAEFGDAVPKPDPERVAAAQQGLVQPQPEPKQQAKPAETVAPPMEPATTRKPALDDDLFA